MASLQSEILTKMWSNFTYEQPRIMGILNITPDSFFDGGAYSNEEQILACVGKMLADGAHIIDVGAYSSRPGANNVSDEEEFRRLKIALSVIKTHFPQALVSVDTFRLSVVQKVLDSFGEIMVNDISGGDFSKEMIPFCGKMHLPYVCMHMQGTPQTMQNAPHYSNVVNDILDFFKQKIEFAQQCSCSHFVLDPGFGFGKTVEQNYELMNHLDEFTSLPFPVLVGISRKSMIQKVLGCSATEALNGTTVLNTISLAKGAKILRVHDVKEAWQAIQISAACQGKSISLNN